MKLKLLIVLGSVLLFMGASCLPDPPNCPQCPPSPTPTPVPTPSPMQGPRCVDIGAACNCIDFPPPGTPTCVICDPSSPGGVKDIGVVPVCPPGPGPTPTPTPTPQPTPTPTANCTFPQGVPDEQFVEVANPMSMSAIVDQTIRENVAFCDGQTDCTWGPADPQVYLAKMVGALQAKKLCAGQHRNGESDQISVATTCTPGTIWENYQPVNFGGTQHKARFAPANVMSGWTVPAGCQIAPPTPVPTPRPTPTPTPTPSCPPLTNLKMKLEMLADPVVDVTPRGPDCPRCASINKSCDQGVCPLGPEGPTPPDNAQRIACEDFYGPYVFTLNGQPCTNDLCFHHNDNPLQVKVKGHGNVRVVASRTGLAGDIQVP